MKLARTISVRFGTLNSANNFVAIDRRCGFTRKGNLSQLPTQQLGIDMIPAYSPQARGRSGRAFGTHQGRLPQELALAGIRSMAQANQYLAKAYLPAFNAEFAQPAMEQGSAFVPWIGGCLEDILCEQFERTVSPDNCVRFDGMILQIPADQHRCHYVKARVRVNRYASGALALFHGPRGLAYFTPDGRPITDTMQQAA